jgi:hypothetical protein
VASAEGDDWKEVVAGGSEAIVGQAHLARLSLRPTLKAGSPMLSLKYRRPSEKYPEKHETHSGESEYRADKQKVLVNRHGATRQKAIEDLSGGV